MTLQLYILRQLAVSISFALAGIALFVLPTTLIQAIHKLPGVSILVVLQYLPMVLVELVPYLLPMAFLLGVVATYGRMAAERELVAIRMAGIHPGLLSLPAFAIAAVLSVWTGHLLSNVSPEWKYQSRNFARHQAVEAFKNFGGRTELEFGRSTLSAERSSGNLFQGVLIDLVDDDGEVRTVIADQARLEVRVETHPETGEPDEILEIELQNMRALGESIRVENESPLWRFWLSDLFHTKDKDKNEPRYLTSREMRNLLRADEVDPGQRDELRYEIQRRRALSWIYLVFLLLGIPTGIVLRAGTQLGAFTGAVGYGFVYYVLALQLGKALAKSGDVVPVVAAWTTNGLFLVIGLILFYRALWR